MTCTDEDSHEFTDGMFVTFSGIQGMAELNACEPIEIKVRGMRDMVLHINMHILIKPITPYLSIIFR